MRQFMTAFFVYTFEKFFHFIIFRRNKQYTAVPVGRVLVFFTMAIAQLFLLRYSNGLIIKLKIIQQDKHISYKARFLQIKNPCKPLI